VRVPPFHPHSIDCGQAQPSRLHDRFLYTLGDSGWTIDRLAP